MWVALAAAALVWLYRGTLGSYLRDQHFQEHFLFLWLFLALALRKSLRGPFRSGFDLVSRRDRSGLAMIGAASCALAASDTIGSSFVARTSLVLFLTGVALLSVPSWSARRCVMHGLLMQLCFGLPYQTYAPLTAKLQLGVATMLSVPVQLGLADYSVERTSVRFADYELVITPDCAGFGQLLTFCGIAALGVLSSMPNRRRTIRLLAMAVLFAWASNLARAALFVALVAGGARTAIEDATWHALIGFLVFLPFAFGLVRSILRTHQPLPQAVAAQVPGGRWPVVLLVVPMVAIHLALAPDDRALPAPPYFAALEQPPGHRLELRGPTEASDRSAYNTPWLLNARFRDAEGGWFDLLHYATRSHSHLCVHRVASCLAAPGQHEAYHPPVAVDGRPWWRIDFDCGGDGDSHVYFAFEVAGQRYDDSAATQFEVFWQRLFGGSWEVRLTRVVLPGRLPAVPSAKEADVLTWLGRLTSSP